MSSRLVLPSPDRARAYLRGTVKIMQAQLRTYAFKYSRISIVGYFYRLLIFQYARECDNAC